jgi:tetratricopeptide (TPR) repeat protein
VGIAKLMRMPNVRRYIAPGLSAYVGAVQNQSPAPLSTDECSALIVAGAAVSAGNPERAIRVLEGIVDGHGTRAHPRIVERLSEAQFIVRRGEAAEQVLRRGLDNYPADGELRRALAAALARRSESQEAIQHWEQLPESLRKNASVWVIIGMARAYRLMDQPAKATKIAQEAAASRPSNAQLDSEIARCRPYLVHWPNSLVATVAETSDAVPVSGQVETMGFLGGGNASLQGHINNSDYVDQRVILSVNGHMIASTAIAPSLQEPGTMRFSINCAELLEYLGDGDIVSLACNGRPITFPALGARAMVRCGQSSRIDALLSLLEAGYVFTKDGRLRSGHDTASKRAVLDFYGRVATLLGNGTGQAVYPFYGNLLGAIRQNDFIEHDVDGFDLLYLCAGRTVTEVKAEVAAIYALLRKHGFHLQVRSASIMIREQPGDTVFLDLNYGWFNAANRLNVAYGWRFKPVRGRRRFVATRSCRLVDRDVNVPGNAEQVLEQLYGPHWQIPDQGYSARGALLRDQAYLLGATDIARLNESSSSV